MGVEDVSNRTVQAWMGHESIANTNQYLHFMGTSAHTAGRSRHRTPKSEETAGQKRPAVWMHLVELRRFETLTFSLRMCPARLRTLF